MSNEQEQIDYSRWLSFMADIEDMAAPVLEQMIADLVEELERRNADK